MRSNPKEQERELNCVKSSELIKHMSGGPKKKLHVGGVE